MRLPDFNQHEGMLSLRRQMNARRPGHFVLFDASKHLTGQERSRLENQGIQTTYDSIRVLPDQTLAIKNGRVVVLFADEGVVQKAEGKPASKRKKEHFHVAGCSVLQARHREPLVATTCLSSPFPVPGNEHKRRSLTVCPECLALLSYRGFSLTRNRRIRYSEGLLRGFQLQDFFRIYTLYPVRIEGHL
ncbi:hypothetical protein [Oceanospirillum linum]|nr:hypothetical protein [Oceanospirillum linum]SEF70639.1 hypothetical protein SAMN04489856_10230 [Oleiphilus messinensis]SMP15395.1 hypothetical protein SAMN06264348_10328 [Oceanospirillum linum]